MRLGIPGTNWQFAHPLFLLLLLVVPLLWWLWRGRRHRTVVRYSGLDAIRSIQGAWAARRRALLPILRSIALLCLIVAAARPQYPDETRRIFAEGVAIQLVIDVSSSMQYNDLSVSRNRPQSRLDVVKEVLHNFIGDPEEDAGNRPNDLIGLIKFAGYADAIAPLTLDHRNVLDMLDQTDFAQGDEDGTAIGNALGLAVERLREVKRTSGSGRELEVKSRVVVLLTDGEDNAQSLPFLTQPLTPEQAGDLAQSVGIKVYTILAGSNQPATGRFMMPRPPVNDRALRYIAETTGGKHFRARDKEALSEVYAAIDELERTEVEERTNLRWGELSGPLLLAAFAALSLQLLLDSTWLRKIP